MAANTQVQIQKYINKSIHKPSDPSTSIFINFKLKVKKKRIESTIFLILFPPPHHPRPRVSMQELVGSLTDEGSASSWLPGRKLRCDPLHHFYSPRQARPTRLGPRGGVAAIKKSNYPKLKS